MNRIILRRRWRRIERRRVGEKRRKKEEREKEFRGERGIEEGFNLGRRRERKR